MAAREATMASSTLRAGRPGGDRVAAAGAASEDRAEVELRRVLLRLASLKITVTLFAMSIFLVLVGTLAQVEKDIWQVVEDYFRTAIAWVDVRVFFPPSFFPGLVVPEQIRLPGGFLVPLGFYFPGGWLIGALLMVNLAAAHLVRFPAQATGSRLWAGRAVAALGLALIVLVIVFDAAPTGGARSSAVPRAVLWWGLVGVLALGVAAAAWLASRPPRERPVARGVLIATAGILAAAVSYALGGGPLPRLGDSSLRILGEMLKGQLATLVLFVGCWLLYRRRAGLVLLHGGIGLMMIGEVLTGLTAVEGHMQLAEGETVNFVEQSREVELAVIDRSAAGHDVVVAVPESRLLRGGRIASGDLPFDLQVVDYLPNSSLRQVGESEANPATAGIGTSWVADPERPVSGTDGGRTNLTSAYVAFFKKGTSQPLGTHLVSLALAQVGFADQVEVDGKRLDIHLRHRRTYKPYALTLLDVQKEDYPGTDIPRHYASSVQLVDEGHRVDRTARIWMNNPLRFAGETLYQSGYFRDPQTGAEASTLAVVTNTGRMIPYVSCMIVATGLIAHFAGVLGRFLRRRPAGDRATEPAAAATQGANSPRGRWGVASRLAVPAVVVLCAVWLVGKALPPAPAADGLGLYAFGSLPVIDHGRAKPVDSLARTSLQVLSNRPSFVDAGGARGPAIRWFLDLISRPEVAARHRVFRIEHPDLLVTLGLEAREGFRYGLDEFSDHLGDFARQVELAAGLDPAELSTYQKKVLELERKLSLWRMLVQSYAATGPMARAVTLLGGAGQAARLTPPLAVPGGAAGEWQTLAEARLRYLQPGRAVEGDGAEAARALAGVVDAYAEADAGAFNAGVARAGAILAGADRVHLDDRKVGYEAFFNHFDPTYHAAVLYATAFVLIAISWLRWGPALNRLAFGVILAAFALHLFILVSRIYISGRPPVTNLYSSAIFIGWAGVLLGIGYELVYRLGVGNVIASLLGFATLLVAHFLGTDGDTFAVLQAVLDTQFWLATHVVCITLGYSATYVAGLLGMLYILRGVLTPSLTGRTRDELSRMIYGTLAFAILFSFVGTVLGGLWADDSWGRFWGWDPKENGALIIVLWNAMVLHALRGGLVRQRGLAILAVAGNITVSWSWFGVNELGIGLHSYGFTEGVLRALGLFVATQLAIVALGLIPERRWWSGRRGRMAA
jgi:ABC-type transport system involved in cytochrome c biogenesis permease subunit